MEKLFAGMTTAIEVSTGRAIGFVIDADSPLQNRWQQARSRLQKVGMDTPSEPPTTGFIACSVKFRSTVGIWLMPDNQQDGTLEHFLQTLIAENDVLWEHAAKSTDAAALLDVPAGKRFAMTDRDKAVLHTWLAWQREPGLPFGAAMKAKFFGHESEAANSFVAWFRGLFGIDGPL